MMSVISEMPFHTSRNCRSKELRTAYANSAIRSEKTHNRSLTSKISAFLAQFFELRFDKGLSLIALVLIPS